MVIGSGPPAAATTFAASARLAALDAASTVCAPSRANATTMARPMPRLPPLTTTTFPSNSCGIGASPDFVQALYAASVKTASGSGAPRIDLPRFPVTIRKNGWEET